MEMQELMKIFDMGDGGLDLEELDFLGGITDEDIQLSQLCETVERDYALNNSMEKMSVNAPPVCAENLSPALEPMFVDVKDFKEEIQGVSENMQQLITSTKSMFKPG